MVSRSVSTLVKGDIAQRCLLLVRKTVRSQAGVGIRDAAIVEIAATDSLRAKVNLDKLFRNVFKNEN